MNWFDEGIVLSVRPHGETAAVVELLTRAHGRYLGLVHGGQGRRLRPVLQIGNHVEATWKGRLSEQLGFFTIELRKGYAAEALERPLALTGLTSLCALARLLPERDPHPDLFEISLFVLSYLDDDSIWPALYVRWELNLLAEMGFGLDLSSCAATGTTENLVWVSPKSGRAVSATAGEPYRDRLLPLPQFLIKSEGVPATRRDVLNGLALTGAFISKRILIPQNLDMPEARQRLVAALSRSADDNVLQFPKS
ncbi:MAG: DNA repair protein RecO [Proteobacteria bacterium]|jgi:DNA repair protein RecO|nr:MAG: DNA repair protein RecO [Pseudomonadota bacterium]